MDYSETQMSENIQSDILQLNEQLHQRDELVDQLSTELYRLIKANPAALPAASGSMAPTPAASGYRATEDGLNRDLSTLETQIEFYQTQIDKRDTEIAHLQNSCQRLSERNHMLENVIQELPEVYRQKFSNRLEQVDTKVKSLQLEKKSLQLENRRLYSALQETHPGTNDALSADKMSLPAPNQASREQTS